MTAGGVCRRGDRREDGQRPNQGSLGSPDGFPSDTIAEDKVHDGQLKSKRAAKLEF